MKCMTRDESWTIRWGVTGRYKSWVLDNWTTFWNKDCRRVRSWFPRPVPLHLEAFEATTPTAPTPTFMTNPLASRESDRPLVERMIMWPCAETYYLASQYSRLPAHMPRGLFLACRSTLSGIGVSQQGSQGWSATVSRSDPRHAQQIGAQGIV